jgi:hypothetical protein
MSALACPFKPVSPRAVMPHEHHFLAEITLGQGLFVQDCGCGHRRRVRKGSHGDVLDIYEDGLVDGGSSIENAVFLKNADGHFVDRWALMS